MESVEPPYTNRGTPGPWTATEVLLSNYDSPLKAPTRVTYIPHPEQQKTRPSAKTRDDRQTFWSKAVASVSLWPYELLSVVLSILAFLAIIALLRVYEGKKTLEQWELPISLNAVISILAAVFKGSLAMPIAEENKRQETKPRFPPGSSSAAPSNSSRSIMRSRTTVCNTSSLRPGTYSRDPKDGIAEALQSDDDSQQGEIAFFVSMMPNLQSLQITVPESKGILLSLFHAFASDKTGTRFSKLHDLGLRYWDTEDAICMCEADDLLLAPPALDTFCGFAVNWCRPPETPRPLEFEHISPQHSLIDGPGLSSLLSRCHRLRTLSVTWGNVWVGDCDLDWDEMGDALRLHAPLLERLHLDPILAFRYTDEESTGRIGSLEQLTRLKELELPLEILVGRVESPASGSGNTLHSLAQLLRASLESLHLYLAQDGAEELGEELSKLLEVGSQLANLREIRVAGPGSWRLCIKLVDGVMVKENVWERHLIPPPIAASIPRRL
ncbi:hypothetical protein QBC33DRAFT_601833 [Phialemonium atrogriseum]|uniref:Uncharacterized protein n=1 Tax=Phialemonium atrogriseum TaxID=1093897 RepID=A0AAJ0BQD4_9PEZI|nr:uncharacterized protein QBC33DRAFT_601833 [Phialemonium atrogriseum]KAK1762331.1 hypothetical protein QBC33DRAFT_601833 [Phialemonium atrogriseum]